VKGQSLEPLTGLERKMAAEKEKFLAKETELQALLQERSSALEKALAQREQVCSLFSLSSNPWFSFNLISYI